MAPTHLWGAPAVSKYFILPRSLPKMACSASYPPSAGGCTFPPERAGYPLTLVQCHPHRGGGVLASSTGQPAGATLKGNDGNYLPRVRSLVSKKL